MAKIAYFLDECGDEFTVEISADTSTAELREMYPEMRLQHVSDGSTAYQDRFDEMDEMDTWDLY